METKQHTSQQQMGQRTQKWKNYLEINENENTKYQILWNEAKAVLEGKFSVINTYINK